MRIVWFKRDLRTHDHAPLAEAAALGPILPLYIVEPALWRLADASGRQWAFLRESLLELDQSLRILGQGLVVRVGDASGVISELLDQFPISAVHSHMETGNQFTFKRDLQIKALLHARQIPWFEARQFGVVRGLKVRKNWARQWESLMGEPCAAAPSALPAVPVERGVLPVWPCAELLADVCAGRQRGGRARGLALLDGFLETRGERYSREMSSPLSARTACSRLSPHFAHGTVSLREVLKRVRDRQLDLRNLASAVKSSWPRALHSFQARLHWHCHFIQKLESEPAIEFDNINAAYTGMREPHFDRERFERWASGQTGWPFVDACMRALAATGWINFRMRAMLVAVASYHLWLHWLEPSRHLARLFTDYEPGIHYAQMQMQAGVTGINIPRIYNPIKQSHDQDPDGVFIRRWVAELRGVSTQWIHTPWLAPESIRAAISYPEPMLDHEHAARLAKQRLTQWRAGIPDLRAMNAAVLKKHGSKKRKTAPRVSAPKMQLDLFA